MAPRMLRSPLALLALGLSAPLLAQAAPPAAAPPAAAPSAAPGGPGGTMRDPLGNAAISRKDAEAQAAARFTTLDTDKDGFLSPAELAAARPGRPGGEARRPRGNGPRGGGMMRMMDANGDGKVSRDEFIAGNLRRFDMMDANRDLQLTKAERQAAMEAMRARMEERMRERFQGGGDEGMGGGMRGAGD